MVITEEGIRVDVPLAEMKDRRDVVMKEGYMILHERYIIYKMVATYSGKDGDTEMWSDKKGNFRWVRMRADIQDVSMAWDNNEQLWYTHLHFSDELYTAWFYKDPNEALKLYNTLQDYFITR